MTENSLPMAGYNAILGKKDEREEKIAFCVWATAEIHGITEKELDRGYFSTMDDTTLERECDWLNDLLDK
jgi:hypothetical protein